MATKMLKTAKRTVTLDARPDRPDLRDRIYQPPLVSLPHQYPPPEWIKTYLPRYSKAGLILDQGEEGACTGFGLAAVVNYLLFRQFVHARTPPSPAVSTRMIYHLARKYDEWPGEDYDGSSCRGAMKGWFHHGVCSDALWPYRDKQGVATFIPPDPKWTADAARRPLGAYYRIMKNSITDLQAAINEVGAVYVSSDVHKGWDSIVSTKSAIPTIPWKAGTAPVGGHAFALVGYDANGFALQNSWGEDWGFHGFATGHVRRLADERRRRLGRGHGRAHRGARARDHAGEPPDRLALGDPSERGPGQRRDGGRGRRAAPAERVEHGDRRQSHRDPGQRRASGPRHARGRGRRRRRRARVLRPPEGVVEEPQARRTPRRHLRARRVERSHRQPRPRQGDGTVVRAERRLPRVRRVAIGRRGHASRASSRTSSAASSARRRTGRRGPWSTRSRKPGTT